MLISFWYYNLINSHTDAFIKLINKVYVASENLQNHASILKFNKTFKNESKNDDASYLEPEPTLPKASTTEKVAVPKTSKKIGPRGPYKKKT